MATKPTSQREQLEALFRDERTDVFAPIRKHDAEALKKALAHGASVAAPDADGNTPLYVAVFVDNRDAVEILLKAGANPEVPNRRGTTPLIVAAVKMDLPTMRLLIAAGASPLTRDENGRSALDHVYAGKNLFSGKGNRPRLEAIAMMVETLAKAKNDPDMEVLGMRPIHWAAQANDDEMIQRLLQMGAEPFKPAKNGKTVFECAYNNKKAMNAMLSELAVQFRTEFERMREGRNLTTSKLIDFFESKKMPSPQGGSLWSLSDVQPVLEYLQAPRQGDKLVPEMKQRQLEKMEKFTAPVAASPSLMNKVKERAQREMHLQMAIDAAVLLVSGLPMDAIVLGLQRKHLHSPFNRDWTREEIIGLLQSFGLCSKKHATDFLAQDGDVILGVIADGLREQGLSEETILTHLLASELVALPGAEFLRDWLQERYEIA